ncbi:hypothetical protein VTN77DRAFT_2874 [Rasamsonia byssochlamydoides]|uniref:uncharacterized protein n=1 Tax=Rasamsonia byssochlamydoides TaxID=89139 RepID=UPI003743E812
MPWTQTAPGVFSRPIGENETFIKLVSDPGHPLRREHWAINSTATISPLGALASKTDLPAVLRRAWAHLRFQHPSLAAQVAPDNTHLTYTVPSSPEALQEWTEQTFTVVSDAASASEVIPTLRPGPYATLYYVPQSGELLGHTAHWRTDGIGVLMLLDALLALVAQPDLADPWSLPWGSEAGRLAPAVEDAAGMPGEPSPAQKARAQEAVGSFALAAGAVGIPYQGDAATIPAGTRSAHTALSPAATAAVVQASKAQGFSVTSAVHASVAAANFAHAPDHHRGRHYTSTIRLSLRPFLPEPYSTPAYASGLYTTGWMAKVDADAGWEAHARTYQEQYRRGVSPEYLAGHREYARSLCDLIRNLPQGGEPPSDVDISSIGIAEKLINPVYGTPDYGVEVRAVSVGVEMLTRQAVCFVWTFRNQLNLNVVYNEAFHAPEQMEQFVGTVKDVLLKQLGVAE